MFTLKDLPYAADAMAPYISEQTMTLHHDKHHQAYVNNLNKFIEGTELADKPLKEIIEISAKNPEMAGIFNNGAQNLNHEIFWDSLHPASQEMAVPESLQKLIERDFGSMEKMLEEFKAAAMGQFGSGWAWLGMDSEGRLKTLKTSNADTAFLHGLKPLLALDVWEHSYYLDYQNRRGEFVDAVFANLLNWENAAKRAEL